MRQVSTSARKGLNDIVDNRPATVAIPDTNRTVKIYGIKPYTIECLTRLWLQRDLMVTDNSADELKSLCEEPYFSVKEASLFVLNGYYRIKLFYPILWRIWGKLIGYTEEQMSPIIQAGKKKLPLTAHWMNMAFSADMRTDQMKMTKKEAEQYRAELLLEMNALSSKNSPNTEGEE